MALPRRLGSREAHAQKHGACPVALFPWHMYDQVRSALAGRRAQGLDLLGRAGLIPSSTLAAYRHVPWLLAARAALIPALA